MFADVTIPAIFCLYRHISWLKNFKICSIVDKIQGGKSRRVLINFKWQAVYQTNFKFELLAAQNEKLKLNLRVFRTNSKRYFCRQSSWYRQITNSHPLSCKKITALALTKNLSAIWRPTYSALNLAFIKQKYFKLSNLIKTQKCMLCTEEMVANFSSKIIIITKITLTVGNLNFCIMSLRLWSSRWVYSL